MYAKLFIIPERKRDLKKNQIVYMKNYTVYTCNKVVWYEMSFSSPLEIVNAGDHCDLRISKQMLPLLLIFG